RVAFAEGDGFRDGEQGLVAPDAPSLERAGAGEFLVVVDDLERVVALPARVERRLVPVAGVAGEATEKHGGAIVKGVSERSKKQEEGTESRGSGHRYRVEEHHDQDARSSGDDPDRRVRLAGARAGAAARA